MVDIGTQRERALNDNAAVESALRVLVRVSGLRIALVARVTASTWTACAVLDEAGFNLSPGDQLDLHHTY